MLHDGSISNGMTILIHVCIYIHCMYQTYSFAEAIKRRILRYGVPQRGEAPLIYSNHILSYDRSKRTPVWVAERITQDQTQGKDSSRLSLLRSLFLFSLSLSPLRSVSASLLSLFFSPSRSVSASFLSLSLSLNLSSSYFPFRSVSVSPPLSLSQSVSVSSLSLSLSLNYLSLSLSLCPATPNLQLVTIFMGLYM